MGETLRRFWFNLQVARVLTEKALNSRMGKGKGGRTGLIAYVRGGVLLFAVSSLRLGLLQALHRKLRVRCNFPVLLNLARGVESGFGGFVGITPSWVRVRCLHLHYVSARFLELRQQLLALRRPVLWVYASRLFF